MDLTTLQADATNLEAQLRQQMEQAQAALVNIERLRGALAYVRQQIAKVEAPPPDAPPSNGTEPSKEETP